MAAMKKEDVLILLQIHGLSSGNPKLTAITTKAAKELQVINDEIQEQLDEEAAEEAKKKAEEEAKAKKEAEEKYEKEMQQMQTSAQAASGGA